jgi:hypothetical protein
MYDTIASDAHLIPANAQMVAGYVDGLYVWSDAEWARFPNATKIRIAVFTSTNDGHVLDCEQGNNTPASSVDWVLMRRKAGIDPTVYCGRNTWWSQIRASFQARGVAEPHYWVADYSAGQSIPAGAIALQYTDTGPYDISVVADYWPGVDPKPTPPAPTIQDSDMMIVQVNADSAHNYGGAIYLLSGGELLPFASVTDVMAVKNAFSLPIVALSYATYANWVTAAAGQPVSVTVDSSQLAAALAADLPAALDDAKLLADQGKAYAHAEAVEEHNDTPAS